MTADTIPFISIITPTYNSEKYIRETINSVIFQGYQKYEHIFIDGGSTDNTLAIIQRYATNKVILSEPDNGIADAFNKGIGLARGQIIGIINSDDYYAENIFHEIADTYDATEFDFIVHGDMEIFNGSKKKVYVPRPFPRHFFYFDLPYNHPTVFVPRKIYDDVGLFNQKYKIAMDFDFLLRTMLKGCTFKKLDMVLAHFRAGGMANAHALACHKEVLQAQLNNGLSPMVCFSSFFIKSAVNYLKKAVGMQSPIRE